MIDKKKIFIEGAKKALKETFKCYVGAYPQNVDKAIGAINQKLPSFLVEDGDEGRNPGKNKNLTRDWTFPIWIYSNARKLSQTTLTGIQTEVEALFLSSNFRKDYGVDVICVEYINCEKGGWSDSWDGFTPGYNANNSLRKINLNVRYSVIRG